MKKVFLTFNINIYIFLEYVDLDEYPPAMFGEAGKGASVRPINSSDNRESGSTLGHQLRKHKNGTKVKMKIVE
ncbi:NucA/NucB deoxyribonuclease domain-containing protein [Terrisporobacter vanillatitrophus]|uniref:NucA/NucB deoxyribonuclease domain-containing protein n=1 Tax=Terrisporobacter vanillatitrophus TaxID=3058402 RepID=UPI00336777D6